MADASRDANFVPTLLGASSADGTTPTKVWANPSTHRLLVDLGAGVTGPGSSTDNAIARFDGTTGATIQNSLATINDSGIIDAVGYSAGGTAAVADGTYTVGAKLTGGGVNGTITTKGGIITAVQEAT
jgi:hypothetical protein